MYITDAMVKKFGASMGCARCQNGAGTHACRARMLGMAPRLTWQLIDSPRREAKSEVVRIVEEMQSCV